MQNGAHGKVKMCTPLMIQIVDFGAILRKLSHEEN